MSDTGDQLREAFVTHEDQAPDPAAVYARVQDLARTYKRRRRGAQIAGGAVLTAGLVAGVVTVPSLLVNRPAGVSQVAPAAAPSALLPASLSDADRQKGWDAYFGAGYSYDDAVQLAKLWSSTDEIGDVKAAAGLRLLAGDPLPIKPSPKNVEAAKNQKYVDTFFAAKYTYDDAAKLAKIWKVDAGQAKVLGGKKLAAGETLPIKAGSAKPDPAEAKQQAKLQAQLDAYFAAGYDYDDAVKLAKAWKLADPGDAKIAAGKRLLAGQSLPIKP